MKQLFKRADGTPVYIDSLWWRLIFAGMIVVVAGINIGIKNRDGKMPEGIRMTVEYADTLYTHGLCGKINIKKGEELTVLRIGPGSSQRTTFWVRRDDGTRGLLAQAAFSHQARFSGNKDKSSGLRHGDPLTIVGSVYEHARLYYEFSTPDGRTGKVEAKEVLVDPGWQNAGKLMQINNDAGKYMTPSRFRREYIGKTFEENDAYGYPALYAGRNANGQLAAEQCIYLLNRDGYCYIPTITYNSEGIAEDFTTTRSYRTLNHRPLKWCRHAVWWVLNRPALSQVSDRAFADSIPLATSKGFVRVLYWILLVVTLLVNTVGFYLLAPLGLAYLIYGLLHFRHLFYPIGNSLMRFIIGLLAVAGLVAWFLLRLPDCFWLFILLPAAVVWRFLEWELGITLGYYVPSTRCPDCKSIHTMEHVEDKLIREYDKWNAESKCVGSRITDRSKYLSYTQVTEKWEDEYGYHKKQYDKDKVEHTTESGYNTYIDYNVLYHVKEYERRYKCSFCGHREYEPFSTREEIRRERTGSHTESFQNTSQRNVY